MNEPVGKGTLVSAKKGDQWHKAGQARKKQGLVAAFFRWGGAACRQPHCNRHPQKSREDVVASPLSFRRVGAREILVWMRNPPRCSGSNNFGHYFRDFLYEF